MQANCSRVEVECRAEITQVELLTVLGKCRKGSRNGISTIQYTYLIIIMELGNCLGEQRLRREKER